MVRPIMRDVLFLNQKSEPAGQDDKKIVQDMLDTLRAHEDECVGMAANMIGVKKRIIVVNMGLINIAMINPIIISKSDEYTAEEGCLSLSGVRTTKRYRKIEVEYLDSNFNKRRDKYEGWTAQIIQHEIDHCNGIII